MSRSLLHIAITDYWRMWVLHYPSSNPSSVLSIDLAQWSLTCWFSSSLLISLSLTSYNPLRSSKRVSPTFASLPLVAPYPWISPDFTPFLFPLPSQNPLIKPLLQQTLVQKDGCRSITNLGGYGKDYKLYASFLLRKGLVFFRWRMISRSTILHPNSLPHSLCRRRIFTPPWSYLPPLPRALRSSL